MTFLLLKPLLILAAIVLSLGGAFIVGRILWKRAHQFFHDNRGALRQRWHAKNIRRAVIAAWLIFEGVWFFSDLPCTLYVMHQFLLYDTVDFGVTAAECAGILEIGDSPTLIVRLIATGIVAFLWATRALMVVLLVSLVLKVDASVREFAQEDEQKQKAPVSPPLVEIPSPPVTMDDKKADDDSSPKEGGIWDKTRNIFRRKNSADERSDGGS